MMLLAYLWESKYIVGLLGVENKYILSEDYIAKLEHITYHLYTHWFIKISLPSVVPYLLWFCQVGEPVSTIQRKFTFIPPPPYIGTNSPY